MNDMPSSGGSGSGQASSSPQQSSNGSDGSGSAQRGTSDAGQPSDNAGEAQQGPGVGEVDSSPLAGLKEADTKRFSVGDSFIINADVDGTPGTCALSPVGVSCTGKASDDVPDVAVPPFPAGRPGAVAITPQGVDYTMFEGVPPAPAKLEPGQKVVAGEYECGLADASMLLCSNQKDSFKISGAERRIETSSKPLGLQFVR